MNNIGIVKESSLHRDLKFRYSEPGNTEITRGNYVCDGQTRDGELIEVQTGSFGPLREKVKKLTNNEKIRIIYPIIVSKYIELYDINGKLSRKRKSPQKGCAWDLFKVLLYAPELSINLRVTLELVFLDILEKRKNDGKGSWRRRGVTIQDRIPLSLHKTIILKELNDYNQFLPIEKETFTVKDLGDSAGISRILARKCLYVLEKINVTERVGKQGNALVYKKKR